MARTPQPFYAKPMKQQLFALLILLFFSVTAQAANELENHPSPYLALHGDDPVHWRAWGDEAVAASRTSGKPLFISIGYFSCHWCHVMQRESYKNPDIAKLLNEHFIPVKVDRELNPALDAALIEFVERTRGAAGWPLNVFLTPEGYPMLGLVYLPADRFQLLLDRLQGHWKDKAQQLSDTARRASESLQSQRKKPASFGEILPIDKLLNAFEQQALASADELAGGFGNQNKFPMEPQLSLLLNIEARAPNEERRAFLNATLHAMATQGLRDQLDGGFFRYTVDPAWQVPHFEKMLYDNAQLAELYLRAGRILGNPAISAVGADTLDFLLRRMSDAEGGFIASLSALDDKDVEGGYYLWDRATLKQQLSDEQLAVVDTLWGLNEPSEIADGNLPVQRSDIRNAATALQWSVEKTQNTFAEAQAKLKQLREARTLPRDDKQLSGWNALVLSAMAEAVKQGESRFKADGQALRDHLVGGFIDKDTLIRARRDGQSLNRGRLEDYAWLADALLDWHQVSNNPEDLQIAGRLIQQAWQRFFDDDGWRSAESMPIPLNLSNPALNDGPTPSASARLLSATLRLPDTPQNRTLKQQARQVIRWNPVGLSDTPFFHANLIETMLEHGAAGQ